MIHTVTHTSVELYHIKRPWEFAPWPHLVDTHLTYRVKWPHLWYDEIIEWRYSVGTREEFAHEEPKQLRVNPCTLWAIRGLHLLPHSKANSLPRNPEDRPNGQCNRESSELGVCISRGRIPYRNLLLSLESLEHKVLHFGHLQGGEDHTEVFADFRAC